MALFMAMLLCLLVFPHESFGAERDCPACAAGLECPNLCDCSGHGAKDASHSHEFRNDAAQNPVFDRAPVSQVCMILLPNDLPRVFGLLGSTIGFASRSFAVRHLDTIILRT